MKKLCPGNHTTQNQAAIVVAGSLFIEKLQADVIKFKSLD